MVIYCVKSDKYDTWTEVDSALSASYNTSTFLCGSAEVRDPSRVVEFLTYDSDTVMKIVSDQSQENLLGTIPK